MVPATDHEPSFHKKLRQTLTAIADAESVPGTFDDTFLERVLNLVQVFCNRCCAHSSWVEAYLKLRGSFSATNISFFCFHVRLLPLLSKFDDNDKAQLKEAYAQLLNTCMQDNVWEHTSVRASFIDSIRDALVSSDFVVVSSELLTAAFACTADDSLHVALASRKLIVEIFHADDDAQHRLECFAQLATPFSAFHKESSAITTERLAVYAQILVDVWKRDPELTLAHLLATSTNGSMHRDILLAIEDALKLNVSLFNATMCEAYVMLLSIVHNHNFVDRLRGIWNAGNKRSVLKISTLSIQKNPHDHFDVCWKEFLLPSLLDSTLAARCLFFVVDVVDTLPLNAVLSLLPAMDLNMKDRRNNVAAMKVYLALANSDHAPYALSSLLDLVSQVEGKTFTQILDIIASILARYQMFAENIRMGDVFPAISSLIVKHMESEQWEVRDSVLSLLTALIEAQPISQLDEHLIACMISGLSDAECYVRASALRCVELLRRHSPAIWQHYLASQNFKDSKDAEAYLWAFYSNECDAIPRRAIVQLLLSWLEVGVVDLGSRTADDSVFHFIQKAALDIDWEVKGLVVKIVQLTIDRTLTDSTSAKDICCRMTELHSKCILSTLWKLAHDEDAADAACISLLDFQTKSLSILDVSNFDGAGLSDAVTDELRRLIEFDAQTTLRNVRASKDMYTCRPEELLDDILASFGHHIDLDCY